MKKLTVIAVCLVCMLASPFSSAKEVPNLKLKDLAGHSQKLSDLRSHIVVLSFWATWCAPCQEELPRLSKLSQEYADSSVRFVAVSIDEAKDRAKIEPYLTKQDIHLDVWVGGTADMLGRFGLGNIVPGTLIIDKQGQVITRIMGEAKDEDVRSRLDWLLHGRQGPAPEQKLKRY